MHRLKVVNINRITGIILKILLNADDLIASSLMKKISYNGLVENIIENTNDKIKN